MRKIAGYLTKNRNEKDQKIAQSTHENGYIKPRKTFWRNSKQLLKQCFFFVVGQNGGKKFVWGQFVECSLEAVPP